MARSAPSLESREGLADRCLRSGDDDRSIQLMSGERPPRKPCSAKRIASRTTCGDPVTHNSHKHCRLSADDAASERTSPKGLSLTTNADQPLRLSAEASTENRIVINELQTSAAGLEIIPPLREVLDGCRTFILSYYQLGVVDPCPDIPGELQE